MTETFNKHDYLVGNGFEAQKYKHVNVVEDDTIYVYIKNPVYSIHFGKNIFGEYVIQLIYDDKVNFNAWYFRDITPSSIDKCIELIKFLNEIEKE
jgi:hypothetical protein